MKRAPRRRLVLDTGALWDVASLRALVRAERGQLILPAVAYTERARQLHRDGRDARSLDRLVEDLRIVLESFTAAHGLAVAAKIKDDARWQRMARDAFIAGTPERMTSS